MNRQPLVLAASRVCIAAALLVAYIMVWSPPINKPAANTGGKPLGVSAQLLEDALNASTVDMRKKAAADLVHSNEPDAVDGLRRLLVESKDFEVLAMAIEGLGVKKDVQSIPSLCNILEKKSPDDNENKTNRNRLRLRAFYALARITDWQPSPFDDSDPLDDQRCKEVCNAARFCLAKPLPSAPK